MVMALMVLLFTGATHLAIAQDTNTGGPANLQGSNAAPVPGKAATPSATLVFDLGPGTGAPPSTLGGYTMTPVPYPGAPGCTGITPPGPIPTPGGDIDVAPWDMQRCIGAGWFTWSHGYSGDVYFTGGTTSQTITLPPGTAAFYFYVEPNPFEEHTFEVVADGESSGTFTAHGDAGATYVGVYDSGGGSISTITITSSADFATGEFGWSGDGGGAGPDIDVDPPELEIEMPTGSTRSVTLDIGNVGGAMLEISSICDETAGGTEELVFDLSPGTGAPPATLGGYTMTPVPYPGAPGCTGITPPGPIPTPDGDIDVAPWDTQRCIGAGWLTWSHGYSGDVYFTGGTTSQTITLPPGTDAFYFYVEPDPFAEHTFEVVADGVSSGPFTAHGDAGATYVGVYHSGGGSISTITITGSAAFASGEFGWSGGDMVTLSKESFSQMSSPNPQGTDSGNQALSINPGFAPAPRKTSKGFVMGDLINDGSFENGPPPASAWTEWSSTGLEWIIDVAPIWGIPAFHGTYTFWAGGYSGFTPNSDYVEQNINIPTGTTNIRFWTNFYRPDDDDVDADVFRVTINGTPIFSRDMVRAHDTYPSWEEQVVNISGYAGQTVMLRFEATSAGDLTGNVLVDHITLEGGGSDCACGPDAPWMSVSPTSGTVPPGGSLPVTVFFDTSGMDPGTYLGTIRIGSNDPDEPCVLVPVKLIVDEDGPQCDEDDSGALDIVGKAGAPGGSVTIPVRIQNAPNSVETLGFEVRPPGFLTFTGFTKGPLVEGFQFFDCNVPDDKPDVVRCGGFTTEGGISAGETGDVVLLDFDVSDCTPGRFYALDLQEPKDDISNWPISGGCYQCGCDCDITGDEDVTPQDALCAFQKYLGIEPTDCGPAEEICCDVTVDDDCTPADALEIFREYLGITPNACSSPPQ